MEKLGGYNLCFFWKIWNLKMKIFHLENVHFKRQRKELEAEQTNWEGQMIGRKRHTPCAGEKPVLFECPFVLQQPLNTLGDRAGRAHMEYGLLQWRDLCVTLQSSRRSALLHVRPSKAVTVVILVKQNAAPALSART